MQQVERCPGLLRGGRARLGLYQHLQRRNPPGLHHRRPVHVVVEAHVGARCRRLLCNAQLRISAPLQMGEGGEGANEEGEAG